MNYGPGNRWSHSSLGCLTISPRSRKFLSNHIAFPSNTEVEGSFSICEADRGGSFALEDFVHEVGVSETGGCRIFHPGALTTEFDASCRNSALKDMRDV